MQQPESRQPNPCHLRRLLRLSGLTQRQVAERLGKSERTIRNWLRTGKVDHANLRAFESLAESGPVND